MEHPLFSILPTSSAKPLTPPLLTPEQGRTVASSCDKGGRSLPWAPTQKPGLLSLPHGPAWWAAPLCSG